MISLLIINVFVVNEGIFCELDVYIDDGCIVKLGVDLFFQFVDWVIDVIGKYFLLGMIDDQVYFCEFGLIYKGEIVIEFVVVVVGGIISYFEMLNVNLLIINCEVLEDKYQCVV